MRSNYIYYDTNYNKLLVLKNSFHNYYHKHKSLILNHMEFCGFKLVSKGQNSSNFYFDLVKHLLNV